MDFYELLSSYYDEIFKSSQVKLDFLSKGLSKTARILDIGAGTGTFSIPMAERGYEVYAVDVDPFMVGRMKEKSSGMTNHFFGVLGMESISKIGSRGPFDMAYCIGNTIVHLKSFDEMGKFLSDAREALSKNGEMIIQTVNYDKVIRKLEEEGSYLFPEITLANGLVFRRSYEFSEEEAEDDVKRIVFKGEIDGKTGETVLVPTKANDLMKLIIASGYSKASIYGDFDMSEYSEDSPAIVIRAKA